MLNALSSTILTATEEHSDTGEKRVTVACGGYKLTIPWDDTVGYWENHKLAIAYLGKVIGEDMTPGTYPVGTSWEITERTDGIMGLIGTIKCVDVSNMN